MLLYAYRQVQTQSRDEITEHCLALHIDRQMCLLFFAGDLSIVQILVDAGAQVDALDINDHTPLHKAARWSDSIDEENEDRISCIECLMDAGADINALNIRRESPLHIACRYSSSSVVKYLLKYNADLLQTNVHGLNCLEVAIEEKNKKIVEYLIEHNSIFSLMRNAQVRQRFTGFWSKRSESNHECCCVPCCKGIGKCVASIGRFLADPRIADTPMRKLIVSMPDMALQILEKCTKTIGDEKSNVYRKFYDYEFLEDQYVIHQWLQGNSSIVE